METQWIFSPIDAQQEVLQQQIATELGVSPVIAKILVQRGITTFEEARLFFRPDLSQLHDPFLMKDMDKAVDRLNLAAKRRHLITVIMMWTALQPLRWFTLCFNGTHLTSFLHSRPYRRIWHFYQGIDYAKSNGYSLIIALFAA